MDFCQMLSGRNVRFAFDCARKRLRLYLLEFEYVLIEEVLKLLVRVVNTELLEPGRGSVSTTCKHVIGNKSAKKQLIDMMITCEGAHLLPFSKSSNPKISNSPIER